MGSSRSGSTWLARMLGELGRIAVIDDPHIGHHLGIWRPISLAWATAQERPDLRTLGELKAERRSYFFNERYADAWKPALRELIEVRFAAEVADSIEGSPELVVVKEPGSQAAELLLSLFPGSRLIFLLRDGRDVVDSWLDAYSAGSWAMTEGAFAVGEAGRIPMIEWLANVWRYRTAAVRKAFDAQAPDRRVLVRYEDLLADSGGELLRIAAACGLGGGPRVEAAAARAARLHSFDRVPPDRRGDGNAVRSASPGGWRENLSEREQRALHRALGPELDWALAATGDPSPRRTGPPYLAA